MFLTVSPPHAPYDFPYSLLLLCIGVCGKEAGGHTASHAPESIVIKVGVWPMNLFETCFSMFGLLLCFTILPNLLLCLCAGLTPMGSRLPNAPIALDAPENFGYHLAREASKTSCPVCSGLQQAHQPARAVPN